MAKNQQRITPFERQIIEVMLRVNRSYREIAKNLGRDPSVISREVKRNSGDVCPYTAVVAQRIAGEKAKKTNKRKLEKNETLRNFVVSKLRDDWSPQQISGRLKNKPPSKLKKSFVSHEAIYQYIYNGEGRFEYLYSHLRRGQNKRQIRRARKMKKTSIPERISINLRPEEINQRLTFGHWESDTVLCRKQKEVISVQFERKTKLTRIHKVQNKSADETENAIRRSIESLPEYLWKSITFDNGGEGANHVNLKNDFNLKTYFCDPYCSWQKGGVENTNGLLRQYIPKKADLKQYSDNDIYLIQEKLNNRPRKSLNYLTPNEVLTRETGWVVH